MARSEAVAEVPSACCGTAGDPLGRRGLVALRPTKQAANGKPGGLRIVGADRRRQRDAAALDLHFPRAGRRAELAGLGGLQQVLKLPDLILVVRLDARQEVLGLLVVQLGALLAVVVGQVALAGDV